MTYLDLSPVSRAVRYAAQVSADPSMRYADTEAHREAMEIAEMSAANAALVSFVRFADDSASEFLGVLDSKYAGAVERTDARPLREISQVASQLREQGMLK